MELTDKFDDDIINEAMKYLPLTILRMCTINEEDESCQKKVHIEEENHMVCHLRSTHID